MCDYKNMPDASYPKVDEVNSAVRVSVKTSGSNIGPDQHYRKVRLGFDVVAALAHILTLSVYLGTDPLEGRVDVNTSKNLLVSMEAIALTFHLFYIANFLGYIHVIPYAGINRAKWVEYGVTATLGSIAVLLSNGPTGSSFETGLIVTIAIMGGVQQAQGDLIEQHNDVLWYAFATGALLQIAEFAAVLVVVSAGWLTIQYIILYSLFGVLCLVSVLQSTTQGSFGNVVFVECLYSALGWITKVAIFWTFVAKEGATDQEYLPSVLAIIFLCLSFAAAKLTV